MYTKKCVSANVVKSEQILRKFPRNFCEISMVTLWNEFIFFSDKKLLSRAYAITNEILTIASHSYDLIDGVSDMITELVNIK